MPKILLITILILVIVGHIFAVKEYTIEAENKDAIKLENLDEMKIEYENYGPIQIIESPLPEEQSISIKAGNGKDCIFFDNNGMAYQDECLIQVIAPL